MSWFVGKTFSLYIQNIIYDDSNNGCRTVHYIPLDGISSITISRTNPREAYCTNTITFYDSSGTQLSQSAFGDSNSTRTDTFNTSNASYAKVDQAISIGRNDWRGDKTMSLKITAAN